MHAPALIRRQDRPASCNRADPQGIRTFAAIAWYTAGMSRIPDFAKVDFADARRPRRGAAAQPWLTPEGIPVKPAYGPDDVTGLDFLDTYPGIAPYLRGPYPTMYVTQPWTIRQYAGFSTAEDSNAFYRRNLAAGQKGLSVAFDLATHRGYDCDHPRVSGDVGMAGVAINSIYDMRTLFSGIPLDQMTRVDDHERRGAAGAGALHRRRRGTGRAAGEARRHDPERHPQRVHGAQHLHLSARRRRCASSPTSSPTPREHMPKFNSISISGYHMQEAGATQDLELAYTLADGVEYVRAGIKAGLDIDRFAPRLSFFWAIGMNFFMEVAKLRAARLLWAKLMKEFDPKDPRSLSLRTHCQTSGWSLAAQDVFNNVARTCDRGDGGDAGPHPVAAHQRARRGAGAADRLLRPHRPQHPDRAAAGKRHHPHRRSVGRLVLCRAADRTSSRSKAWGHIQEVEELGGMAKAIEAGIPKLRIEEAAAKTQARIDAGAAVGDRRQQIPAGRARAPIDVLKVDNSAVRHAADRQARAAAGASAIRAQLAGRARRADPRRRRRQRQSAGARGRRRARQGDRRRDLGGAGEGLGPPPRRDQVDLRRVTSGRSA